MNCDLERGDGRDTVRDRDDADDCDGGIECESVSDLMAYKLIYPRA